MRVVGVDPGLSATGYGVVEVVGGRCLHVRHGVLRTRPSDSLAVRLVALRDGLRALLREVEPREAAIEGTFVGTNARSALTLGHARAAAILALADCGLAVHEYAPALVKQTVAGYGRGDKTQIAEMVRLQLALAARPSPADAADALAVAITHWAHARLG
ncbi:MAG: crossover junction endodeoxyribonuclease RuvC [Dehalococcoidia bacterium]|nr:crossover junction endodeoxyribonuclease RuvC [Dehalococcoidia bacterium]